MFVRKLAWFFICLLGIVVGTASAQSESRIRTVIPSIDHIEADLKWLIELSPDPSLRKQWNTLKNDILAAMEQGIDLSQPLCVDVVFQKDEVAYELRLPISQVKGEGLTEKNGFIAGLKGIGYIVTASNPGAYYSFMEKKGQAPFYLRYDKNYVWISKTQIPGPQPNPVADLQPLLGLQKDVVTNLKNDQEGLAARRENFKKLRQQFEALVKFRRNEDPHAFELRKLAVTQQLDEAERFLVETEDLLVSWNTSTASPASGRGEISLTALPDTELLKSIQQIASKSSHFANVTFHADPLAQVRINFALDSFRVAHMKDFYKTVRPTLDAEVAKLAVMNDSQKSATKQAASKLIDMLDTGLSLGVIDLFADGYALQPDKNVFICGVRCADGTVADEIVNLVPKINADWKVKPAVLKHADVTIHEITIPKSLLPAFQKLFASESVFYVGTSKNVVWGAAGTDSTKVLQAAIDQTALPAPENVDPVAIKYQFQLDQLVNLTDLFQKAAPQKAAAANKDAKAEKEQKQREKDLEKYRKLAHDSMSGCKALMQGELKRTGDKIEGHLELSECILKYIGSMIADGVKVLQ